MRSRSVACIAASLALLVGCVPRAAPPPAPAPRPAPAPIPPPAPPAPPPPPADWRLAPLSTGDWSYRRDGAVAVAAFGPPGAPAFVVRCEAGGRVMLARTGATGTQASMLMVRTSFGERRLPAVVAHMTDLLATVPAADPLLDQMLFSRGRFLVQAEGTPTLIVPAWPEPARVIEECRT